MWQNFLEIGKPTTEDTFSLSNQSQQSKTFFTHVNLDNEINGWTGRYSKFGH